MVLSEVGLCDLEGQAWVQGTCCCRAATHGSTPSPQSRAAAGRAAVSVSREMPSSIICNARGSSLLSTLSASRSTWKHFLWLFLLRALVPQRRFPRCEFFATRKASEMKGGARGYAYPR